VTTQAAEQAQRHVERCVFELNLLVRTAALCGVEVRFDLVDRPEGKTEVLVHCSPDSNHP